jgi:hypothetical protein
MSAIELSCLNIRSRLLEKNIQRSLRGLDAERTRCQGQAQHIFDTWNGNHHRITKVSILHGAWPNLPFSIEPTCARLTMEQFVWDETGSSSLERCRRTHLKRWTRDVEKCYEDKGAISRISSDKNRLDHNVYQDLQVFWTQVKPQRPSISSVAGKLSRQILHVSSRQLVIVEDPLMDLFIGYRTHEGILMSAAKFRDGLHTWKWETYQRSTTSKAFFWFWKDVYYNYWPNLPFRLTKSQKIL